MGTHQLMVFSFMMKNYQSTAALSDSYASVPDLLVSYKSLGMEQNFYRQVREKERVVDSTYV